MITRCDHCGSTFEVSAELLNSGDPSVRCGECMSLFDARANLYNEADFQRASATLKPVHRSRVVKRNIETVDSVILETADTVAVEHIYTAAGAALSSNSNAGVKPPTNYDSGVRLDIDLDDTSDRNREHRVNYRYPEDLEFEQTIATESAHINLNSDVNYRQSTPPRRYPDRGDESRNRESRLDATTAEQEARHKQQTLREREQRALQMEPERDFESSASLEQYDSRLHAENRHAANRRAEARVNQTSIDDGDLAHDAGITARGDHAFIPDDVLKRSTVLRDDGRRDDLQFRADTPRFATSLGDSRRDGSRLKIREPQASTVDTSTGTQADLTEDRVGDRTQAEDRLRGAVRKETRTDNDKARRADKTRRIDEARRTDEAIAGNGYRPEARSSESRGVHREPESRRTEESRPNSERLEKLHSSEFQHLFDQDVDELAVQDRQLEVAGSSAQEMRRYQHYRPSVDVDVAPDVTDEGATSRHRGLGIKSVLWLVGLCAAICLLLFAARNVIANMNLPEPLITGFCQVTGCVPAEAKKNVDQLKTMRKSLYPHPEIENALVISVDVINDSVYKQPYPTLAVTLLDADGGTIAERAFESADYEVVDGGESGFLMPGNPTRFKVEVVDTGLDAEELELVFE